jgi:hypothetical protein
MDFPCSAVPFKEGTIDFQIAQFFSHEKCDHIEVSTDKPRVLIIIEMFYIVLGCKVQ